MMSKGFTELKNFTTELKLIDDNGTAFCVTSKKNTK